MTEIIGEQRKAPVREVSVASLTWLGLGGLFVLLRLAGVLSIPIGGAELDSLSGAWQAHAGNDDVRFLSTFFQAVTAWSFTFTSSEVPARVLVLIASASVPFALYRLRSVFGEVATLAALFLLALDPVSVLLGSTAWAGGFDIAIALWLLVAMNETALPKPLLAAAGFAGATAGPVVLPVVLAATVLRLVAQNYPTRDATVYVLGGVLAGVVLASFGFGFGWEGPTIPPVAAFAAGFERPWANEHTRYLALLYAAPLIAGGVAAAVAGAYRNWRDDEWPSSHVFLYVWAAISLVWVVVAGGSHDPVPLAAVAIPFALLLGLEASGMYTALRQVDWRWGLPVVGGLLLCAGIAEAYIVDWARVDRSGADREKLIVAGLCVAGLALIGLLASNRRTAGAILVLPGLVGLFVLMSGAAGIAFGGPNEPLPSPVSTIQGREIRDIVRELQREKGGLIVIHPLFENEMTWPFRDSGTITLASRVPADAVAVVWPTSEAAPEGFGVVEGEWSFAEVRRGPDGGFLDYLRWLTNRNSLKNSRVPVAVYLKAGE